MKKDEPGPSIPPARAKITDEEVRKASADLTRSYLHSYYASWRLAQVLTAGKLLEQRHSFYADIAADVRQEDDPDGTATIAQEVRNGLHFEAIAHCVQYVEDLFALIRASRRPGTFIRDVVTYDAGKVTSEIRTFKADRNRIAQSYHFPMDVSYSTEESKQHFERGIENLVTWTAEVTAFYRNYEFYYLQYKHGLSVALRPFSKYSEAQVAEDRNGGGRPYLAVYDNRTLKEALSKGTADLTRGVMMPWFTANVRRALPRLEREGKWVRLVNPKDIDLSFDRLVEHAYKVRALICTFCANYSRAVDPEAGDRLFQLPAEYRSSKYYVCSIPQNQGGTSNGANTTNPTP